MFVRALKALAGLALTKFQKRMYSSTHTAVSAVRSFLNISVMSSSPSSGAADEAAPRKGALMRGGSFWDEGIYGLGCGLVYGMTSAVVGFVLLQMSLQCRLTVLCISAHKPALYFVFPRDRIAGNRSIL